MTTWRRARLDPPIRAKLKAEPRDFLVEEELAFEPTGTGEHRCVHIEKTDRTTREVAALLASIHGISHVDVGYAGMKDKRAVARQWFSLRGVEAVDEALHRASGIRVLSQTRHARKLRRGDAAANRFRILLRDLSDDAWEAALRSLEARGAPNYFGDQRFGRDNVSRARAWLAQRRDSRSRSRSRTPKFTQGLYLSVLRSYLFNEVLDERVARSSWCTPIPGDVLEGCHPTGPLWGRGLSPARSEAAEIERLALDEHADLCDALEHTGVRQGRRSLVVRAKDFRWSRQGADLTLTFALPGGSYASAFLSEAFDLRVEGTEP